MRQKPYSSYKSAKTDWMGEVPTHWEVDRLKWSVDIVRNGIWGDEAEGGPDDIVCLRVADFDRINQTVVLDEPTLRKVSVSDRDGRLLEKGDLLLEKSGGGESWPVGFVVEYTHSMPAVCSNFIARMKPSPKVRSRYLRYLHHALYAARVNVRSIKQTSGIQNLDAGSYFDEQVPYPPLEEQDAIATFLDHETTRIDALIAEQRTLIERLREKLRVDITTAITCGLDSKVLTKPSGSIWYGEIPSPWVVRKFKWVVQSMEQGWSPQCDGEAAELDQWAVLKVGCVNGGTFRPVENKILPPTMDPIPELTVKAGDLLVSRANTRELVGSAAVAEEDHPFLIFSDKLYRIRFNPDQADPHFVAYLFQTPCAREQFEAEATGASASMVNISQGTLRDLLVAWPPVAEQHLIVEHLNATKEQVDLLVAEAETGIALLQEHRSALITAVVTGKVDVREVKL